jgi:Ser/Thr protein kinase RdoA (MazF antagonist)
MWLAHIGNIPPFVLSQYGPPFAELKWLPVSGGLSGADVWCGEDGRGIPRFALKHWPAETTSARLTQIHTWMGGAAHLPFVPRVLPTLDGSTSVEDGKSLWDATNWLPGVPCIPADKAKVESACESVAKLHKAWFPYQQTAACPGILRRIEVLSQWLSSPHAAFASLEPGLTHLIQRAGEVVKRTAPITLETLTPWRNVPLHIQPCIRDLRGEHVLFEAAHVSGIVDYGAMEMDSPALDLARLLGDLAGEDEGLFAHGLNKYREFQPNFDVNDRLLRQLARAGVVCSLIGWFSRLSNGRAQSSPENIARRMHHLIVRAEQFNPV